MNKIEKSLAVLNLMSYKEDAVQKIVEAAANSYGPDDQLSDSVLEQKKQVISTVQEIADEMSDQILQPVAEVYAKRYTDEELEQLIAWYSSPLGQKVLEEADLSFQEIQEVLADWGNKLWNRVRVRMGWTGQA